MSENKIRHLGRFKISGKLKALTGLHVGGTEIGLAIGGADSTVIRNGLDGRPYIPGSSIKGKMRCLLERVYTPGELQKVGNARVYKVSSYEEYKECFVSNLFGVTPEDIKDGESMPTRLVVRDALISEESAIRLEKSLYTDMPLTQVKTEVVIDRITSAATPRQIERVPAGATFNYEIVYNIYLESDLNWLKYLKEAMDFLEEDYLGGHGSRGYGQVRFATREITVRSFGEFDIESDSRVKEWLAEVVRKSGDEAA